MAISTGLSPTVLPSSNSRHRLQIHPRAHMLCFWSGWRNSVQSVLTEWPLPHPHQLVRLKAVLGDYRVDAECKGQRVKLPDFPATGQFFVYYFRTGGRAGKLENLTRYPCAPVTRDSSTMHGDGKASGEETPAPCKRGGQGCSRRLASSRKGGTVGCNV